MQLDTESGRFEIRFKYLNGERIINDQLSTILNGSFIPAPLSTEYSELSYFSLFYL